MLTSLILVYLKNNSGTSVEQCVDRNQLEAYIWQEIQVLQID